jgi:hypothetical protein
MKKPNAIPENVGGSPDTVEIPAGLQRILRRFENVRRSGNGWGARCPAHHDEKNSVSVAEGRDGHVLLKCHAGCSLKDVVTALGLRERDLFNNTKKSGAAKGLTLEEYAAAKRLPPELLQRLGISEVFLHGTPALRVPYSDTQGNVAAVRFRLAMEGDHRFRWRTGSKPVPYGLWRIERVRKAGFVCLVEGESDAHTLWLHKLPVIALPGANTWREEWAAYFEGLNEIFVVIEPDRGGEAVLGWLQNSSIRHRVRLVRLDKAKDASDLYLREPANFVHAWKAAMQDAPRWAEQEERDKQAKAKAAWMKCKRLAGEEDILEVFADAMAANGLSGERRATKLLYLMLTSRLLDCPVSGVVTGPSSGGKSFVVKRVLDFFPPSAHYALTAMSERALAYSTEPLSHRFLVLYELAALSGEFQNYALRSLLSEGRLRYETVGKTSTGQLEARLIERLGPTGLLLTTTKLKLHPENATRLFEIAISDSRKQTRRILIELARQPSVISDSQEQAGVVGPWHALQDWLAGVEHRVRIPYAEVLARTIPPAAVRLRRDFRAILNLIKASAILHQANRRRDEAGRIVAKLVDYEAVYHLVGKLVSEGLEQTVPDNVRQTVEAVREICSEINGGAEFSGKDKCGTTARQIADRLKLDRSSAVRRVAHCLSLGYLKNLEKMRGRPWQIVLGDSLPEEERVMPTPEEVRSRWKRG